MLAKAVGNRAAGQVQQWNSHKTVYLTSLSGSNCHLVYSIGSTHQRSHCPNQPRAPKFTLFIIGQENEAEDAPKEDEETPVSSLEDSPKEMEDTLKEEEKAAAIVEAKLEDPEDVEVDEGERRSGTCDDCKPAALSGKNTGWPIC